MSIRRLWAAGALWIQYILNVAAVRGTFCTEKEVHSVLNESATKYVYVFTLLWDFCMCFFFFKGGVGSAIKNLLWCMSSPKGANIVITKQNVRVDK